MYGNGARRNSAQGAYQGTVPENQQAMGAPWMSRDGLSQAIPPVPGGCTEVGRWAPDCVDAACQSALAIPPAYTQYLGELLTLRQATNALSAMAVP